MPNRPDHSRVRQPAQAKSRYTGPAPEGTNRTDAAWVTAHVGLAVPGNVSVVGYDDIPVARYLTPPLTTIRQPMGEVGARAVRILVEGLARRSPGTQLRARHDLVGVSLVVRSSVASAAG